MHITFINIDDCAVVVARTQTYTHAHALLLYNIKGDEEGKEAMEGFLAKSVNKRAAIPAEQTSLWISPICSHCCNYFLQGGYETCKPYRQVSVVVVVGHVL